MLLHHIPNYKGNCPCAIFVGSFPALYRSRLGAALIYYLHHYSRASIAPTSITGEVIYGLKERQELGSVICVGNELPMGELSGNTIRGA